MNTTHTVEVKRENLGLKFAAGVAAIFLLWQFRSFFYASNFSLFASSDTGELGSTSLLIAKILIDSIVFLGGVIIAILTGIWSVIWDVISGFQIAANERNAKALAISEAQIAASTSAGGEAGTQAVATAVKEAKKVSSKLDAAKLSAVLTSLRDRIDALEKADVTKTLQAVDKMAATQQELLNRLDGSAEDTQSTPQE